jgi:DNA methylase
MYLAGVKVGLDCFGGSGTTFAVAQKMNRRWIGVEIGKHADTHIIPRLKKVLTGTDQSGISKAVNWPGGGSFKYYTLGDSIIEPATRDFNWKLGRDFIEKSLLSSYDFASDSEFVFPQEELVATSRQPAIGFHCIGQRQMAGIVSLVEPQEDRPVSYDELMHWYEALKMFKGTHSITVFTNRGIEIAYETKPEDLEVIKVPHAIFAELEK